MRIPDTKLTDSDLKYAHEAAGIVASEEFRPYLRGRLLPVLIARFRDDVAEVLGMQLPPLPQRPQVRPATLSELTSRELVVLSGVVETLVTRFTDCMDDPELPKLLRALREELIIENADRARIADELREKARAS